MKKEIATKLKESALTYAKAFSDNTRDCNYNKADFMLLRLVPYSDFSAGVEFIKSDGKKALMIGFWVKDTWNMFFPTDSHILGLENISSHKKDIEAYNFGVNFS